MSIVSSFAVSFGKKSSSSADGSVIAEWDDSKNVDSSGEVKSQFIPGDEMYLLVYADPSKEIEIVAVKVTAGSVEEEGEVTLDRTDRLGFGDADDTQELSYYPAGSVSKKWWGREGTNLKTSGMKVTVEDNFPCLADLTYPVNFTRYLVKTVSVTLASGETYPYRPYVYFKESGSESDA